MAGKVAKNNLVVISNLARKIFEVATISSLYLFKSNLTESKNLPAQDKLEKRMSKILCKQTEIKLLISVHVNLTL